MSIADAVRARELEARVAVLEQRMAAIEQGNSAHLVSRINLLQGQINGLRMRAPADPSSHSSHAAAPVKTDDAA